MPVVKRKSSDSYVRVHYSEFILNRQTFFMRGKIRLSLKAETGYSSNVIGRFSKASTFLHLHKLHLLLQSFWVHLVNRHLWFQKHLVSGFSDNILKYGYSKWIVKNSYDDNYDSQMLYYTCHLCTVSGVWRDFYFVVFTIIVQLCSFSELNTFTVAGFTQPTTTMAEVRETLQITANNALKRSTQPFNQCNLFFLF